jgi:hypothetical protein
MKCSLCPDIIAASFHAVDPDHDLGRVRADGAQRRAAPSHRRARNPRRNAALEPVAQVRTLGLAERIFSYAVSRRIFRERIERRELSGISLLALGVIITLR